MSSISARSVRGRSAKQRAAALVKRIEAAIEAGEFTPNQSYLFVHPHLGPCGCARAAAQMVSGIKPRPSNGILDKGGIPRLTALESQDLEDGYEGIPRRQLSSPFFSAGRELRKFHPAVAS